MTKIAKLTETLRERIHSGEWEAAQTLPPRMLLSEEYGVAPGTISQVFRNLEQEGLVRVLPRKGVILTDAQPSAAAAQTAVTIGLRGSYLRMGVPGKEGYTGFLINQLLEAAHSRAIPVLILQEHEGEEPLTKARCEAMGVRGLIYLGGDSAREATRLCTEGFPVISAHRPLERSPLNYVDCDHAALVRDVVSRYVGAGHRRIAVVMPQTHIRGLLDTVKPHFIDALLGHNIQYNVNPYWVSFADGKSDEDWQRKLDALFDLEEPPTAIFCWSCHALDAVLERTAARGMQAPGDISLSYTPLNESAYPQISGYSYRNQNFGERLLGGLMDTIRNPFHFVQDELPFEFIDKGSIAPPAGAISPD